MKLNLPISILLATSFWSQGTLSQALQFAREEITVEVHGSSCTLDADYYFKNHGSTTSSWPIYYPLINTDTLPYPDSISIVDGVTNDELAFEKSGDGVLFSVTIPAEQTKKIRVRYSQRTPIQRFEYILTTTQAWGRPLELAEFHIAVPDSLQLIACSLSFDNSKKDAGGSTYHIMRHDFMPESNLALQWKRRIQ